MKIVECGNCMKLVECGCMSNDKTLMTRIIPINAKMNAKAKW